MANVLFVNLTKSINKIIAAQKEAQQFSHEIYHLTEYSNFNLKILRFECNPNAADFIETAQQIIQENDIKYVTTQTDLVLPILTQIKNVKIIPELEYDLSLLSDKIVFAEFQKKHKLPQPEFWVPKTFDDLSNIEGEIFIKPSHGTSGTVSVSNNKNKLNFYDYIKFNNSKQFIELLEKNNSLEDFLETQKNGKYYDNFKIVKSKHLIQRCINAEKYYCITVNVINGELFVVSGSELDCSRINGEIHRCDEMQVNRKQFICTENTNLAPNFFGSDVYDCFINKIKKLIDICKVKTATMNLDLIIPSLKDLDNAFLNDLHFRMGGNIAVDVVKSKIILPHSIWKHIT